MILIILKGCILLLRDKEKHLLSKKITIQLKLFLGVSSKKDNSRFVIAFAIALEMMLKQTQTTALR